MSFLLCHECYNWVEPRDERCPECQHTLDAATPDPPPDALQGVLGEVVVRLGEVRVRRKMLPDRGTLYATTNGLFFLPHQLEHVTQLVETNAVGSSLLWSLAAMIWTPLIFLLPFVKPKQWRPEQVPVFRPQVLSETDGSRLPELLMQNPGVFFVPRRSIRFLQRKRGRWKIERFQGPPVTLKPEPATGCFHERMAELLHCDRWQNVVVG